MMNMQTHCSVLERIEALELANQKLQARCERWKRAGIGGMACLSLMLLGGAALQSHATIEGGEFVLRDKSNRMRAALAIRPDGTPGLGLFDESGKVRLSMELSPQGNPGVNLHSAPGSLGLVLAIRPDGTPGVGLFDAQGRVRTSLDVGLDGSSGINVYDRAGALRAAMAIRPDGTPGIGRFDAQGEVVEEVAREPQPRPEEPGMQPPQFQ